MFNKSRLVKRIVREYRSAFSHYCGIYINEYIKMRKEIYEYSMILLNTHIKTSWMIASIKIFPKQNSTFNIVIKFPLAFWKQ